MVIFPVRNISATINVTFHLQKTGQIQALTGFKALTFVMPVQHSTNNWEKVMEFVQFFIKP